MLFVYYKRCLRQAMVSGFALKFHFTPTLEPTPSRICKGIYYQFTSTLQREKIMPMQETSNEPNEKENPLLVAFKLHIPCCHYVTAYSGNTILVCKKIQYSTSILEKFY